MAIVRQEKRQSDSVKPFAYVRCDVIIVWIHLQKNNSIYSNKNEIDDEINEKSLEIYVHKK